MSILRVRRSLGYIEKPSEDPWGDNDDYPRMGGLYPRIFKMPNSAAHRAALHVKQHSPDPNYAFLDVAITYHEAPKRVQPTKPPTTMVDVQGHFSGNLSGSFQFTPTEKKQLFDSFLVLYMPWGKKSLVTSIHLPEEI